MKPAESRVKNENAKVLIIYDLFVSQDLQSWISSFGEAGFIVVTFGSMISSVSVESLLTEMVTGFSKVPQGVLWR